MRSIILTNYPPCPVVRLFLQEFSTHGKGNGLASESMEADPIDPGSAQDRALLQVTAMDSNFL